MMRLNCFEGKGHTISLGVGFTSLYRSRARAEEGLYICVCMVCVRAFAWVACPSRHASFQACHMPVCIVQGPHRRVSFPFLYPQRLLSRRSGVPRKEWRVRICSMQIPAPVPFRL